MSVVMLTKTPLQANLSYTQAGRDRFESGNPAGSVRGLAWADQAGTLYLEESDDGGGNWSQTATVSVSASTTTSLPWTALTKQLYRFRYVNGASAQTKLRLIQHTRDMELTDTMLIGSSVPNAQAIPVQLSGSNVEVANGEDAATKSALVAGKSSAGKQVPLNVDADGKLTVGIDQTTPGTTNKVVAELSGSNVEIGGVSFAVSGGDTLRNTAANKPNADAAHAAIPFCYYHAIDTGAIEVTDGTNWVVI